MTHSPQMHAHKLQLTIFQGSPYWAFVGFICLAVPSSHPFWYAPEEPYPTSLLPSVKVLPHPRHITSYLGSHRMLLSSGQACAYPMKGTHAKYGKFAYSSAYAYSVPPGGFTLEQFALDSTLGLSDDEGEVWKTRRVCDEVVFDVHDEVPVLSLKSTWRPFKDVKITTWLVPTREETPNWHVRIHKIEAGRDVLTAEGGFAICNVRRGDGRALGLYDEKVNEGTSPRVIGNYDKDDAGEGKAPGRQGAFVVSKGAVGIVDLDMDGGSERTAVIVNADPNSNIVEKKTIIPTLMGSLSGGETRWYICGVYARPDTRWVSPQMYLDG